MGQHPPILKGEKMEGKKLWNYYTQIADVILSNYKYDKNGVRKQILMMMLSLRAVGEHQNAEYLRKYATAIIKKQEKAEIA